MASLFFNLNRVEWSDPKVGLRYRKAGTLLEAEQGLQDELRDKINSRSVLDIGIGTVVRLCISLRLPGPTPVSTIQYQCLSRRGNGFPLTISDKAMRVLSPV